LLNIPTATYINSTLYGSAAAYSLYNALPTAGQQFVQQYGPYALELAMYAGLATDAVTYTKAQTLCSQGDQAACEAANLIAIANFAGYTTATWNTLPQIAYDPILQTMPPNLNSKEQALWYSAQITKRDIDDIIKYSSNPLAHIDNTVDNIISMDDYDRLRQYAKFQIGINTGSLEYNPPTQAYLDEIGYEYPMQRTSDDIRIAINKGGFVPYTTDQLRYLDDNPRIAYELELTKQRLGTNQLNCVDIGCSKGIAADALKAYDPHLNIIGLDATFDILAKSNANLQTANAVAHELPLATNSLDVIIAANWWGYMPTSYVLDDFMTEAQRVLKTGGLLIGGHDYYTVGEAELIYYIRP
jgi:SAM-dependent methyltransferase